MTSFVCNRVRTVLLVTVASAGLVPGIALAQADQPAPPIADVVADDTPPTNEILVEGIRDTQRNSLEIKRNANVIVDALVSDEIGATPDQSVGETLERIVGVTADRFKGSASEISIRGLGPFLGFSTLNGRELTSGSGDRSVSFQQFPSELVNGVLVYKSQNASLVEGGTSGVVELRTLRPIDYGKSRLTVDARGTYEPYDDKISGRNGLGYRISGSYIGQFNVGDGEVGLSIGASRTDEAAPEDLYTESSSVRPCNSIGGNNCSYDETRDPATNPTYFVPNSFLWRQTNNKLTRDAVMGTLQWKPRPELDINVDGQYSRRSWLEDRSDFNLAEGRRGITPTDGGVLDDGTLLQWTGNSYFESQTRLRQRDEDYYGGGLSAEWTDDAAKVGLDVSYSETQRDQVDRDSRLRSTGTNIFAVPNADGTTSDVRFTSGRIPYSFDKTSGTPVLTFPLLSDGTAFDFSDPAIYANNARALRQAEYRNDKIFAVRLDGEAFIADSFLRSIQGGLRYSNHHRQADLSNNNNIDGGFTTEDGQAARQACSIDFRERDYFGDNGTNVTNWAEFDPLCLYSFFAGTDDAGPAADPRSIDDIDVREQIMAGYVMANFANDSDTFGGNIGVRVVNTNVTSKGFRGDFDVAIVADAFVITPTGTFANVTRKNNFTNILPSLNVKFSPTDDVLIRGALYRAISRPNIEDMGAGRQFDDTTATGTSLADALGGVSGGNPQLKPLTSWNADLSFEWYPSEGNAISFAPFYKRLQAGITPQGDGAPLIEGFTIDGQPVFLPVAQLLNSDTSSDLYGFEVTVNHSFSYLPGFLSGFGVIAGYGYADSNFKYFDPSATDPDNPLRNFVEPANFIGLSKHTLSLEGYYEKGPVQFRAVYKYRSPYFKPFELAANRYSQDQTSLDASASIALTKNIQLRFQAINLTNEAYILSRPTLNSVSEISQSGRKYYAGVKLRF